jgi:hypothetical protein
VVAVDAILPAGPQKAQIGVDNAKAGADITAYFIDYVAKSMGRKVKLGIVGALSSFIQNIRQKGFEDVVKGHAGVTMAGMVDGRNIQDNALAVAETLLTGNPDLTVIYATGEPALLGAIAAVESQGRRKDVKVFGWGPTAGDPRDRRRLRDRRRAAGSGGYGCPGGRGAGQSERRGHGRQDHRRADHHRHQGERRFVPRRLQVSLSAISSVASEPAATAPPARPPVMSLRGIGKSFGAITTLRDVDLDLFAGEWLGLVGDNAAGKSTLTKVMSGAYIPDTGHILLDERDVRFTGPAQARALGIEMVYQELSLCDTIDVAGNLSLGREICRGGFLDRRAMARERRRRCWQR